LLSVNPLPKQLLICVSTSLTISVHAPQDVDQRITRDVERLAGDMAALVPTMVKPVVDILWFSTRLWALTGRRGMAVLYIYAALGFGCLRCAQSSTVLYLSSGLA